MRSSKRGFQMKTFSGVCSKSGKTDLNALALALVVKNLKVQVKFLRLRAQIQTMPSH